MSDLLTLNIPSSDKVPRSNGAQLCEINIQESKNHETARVLFVVRLHLNNVFPTVSEPQGH